MADTSEGKGNAGGGIEPKPTGFQSQEQVTAEKSKEALQAAKQPTEETFYDVNKVPEGLKASFSEMQKAFTLKTQDIANVRKQAEAFNTLMQNPAFQSWVESQYLGEPGEGTGKVGTGIPGAGAEEFLTEDEAAIGEIKQRQEELEEQVEISRNEALLDKLAVKYPDLDNYLPQMMPLVEQGDSFESAYFRAKFGQPESEVKKQMKAEILKEMEQEKKAKLEGVGPSGSMLSPVGAKTIEEAYRAAKESHREK